MTRLAETEASIGNMTELLDIVGAMRSLAGMRMQEAEHTLPGIRRYAASIVQAITNTVALMKSGAHGRRPVSRRRALILCAAEHGFVGGFNEPLLAALKRALDPDDEVFVLGSRGAALARERIGRPSWTHSMATRIGGVADLINQLSVELYQRIAGGDITEVEVICARYHQGSASSVEVRRLLPLDPALLSAAPIAQPPLHYLAAAELQERLIAEYVFALLTEACVESIASENAARFASMESAHQNVSKKLDELHLQARLMRQSEITAELLELVTGAEALRGR